MVAKKSFAADIVPDGQGVDPAVAAFDAALGSGAQADRDLDPADRPERRRLAGGQEVPQRLQARVRRLAHHHVAGTRDDLGTGAGDRAGQGLPALGGVMRSSEPITTRVGQRTAAACSAPAA